MRTGGAAEGSAPAEGVPEGVPEVAPIDGLAAPEVYVQRSSRTDAPSEPPGEPPRAPAIAEARPPAEAPEAPPREAGRPAGTVDMGLLHSQVVRARKAFGQARKQLGDDINAAFRKLGQSGGSRAVADFLLKQLEEQALVDLADSQGRTCRAVAVEALLAMGYPYALEISPEDLEHLRQVSTPASLGASGVAGLALALVGGGVEATQVLSLGGRWDATEWMGTLVHVGAILLTALFAALGRKGADGSQFALTLLVLAGLAGAPLYMMGVTPAALGGVAALVAAMLLSRR